MVQHHNAFRAPIARVNVNLLLVKALLDLSESHRVLPLFFAFAR
jgi:hypothetical protein